MNDFAKIVGLLEKYKILTVIFAVWIVSEMSVHWKSLASGNSLDVDQARYAAVTEDNGQAAAKFETQASIAALENTQELDAQGKRDQEIGQEIDRSPFQSPVARQERAASRLDRALGAESFAGASPADPGALSLQAIAMRKGKNIAIINNRPLTIGDKHGSYEVIEINKDFVVLKNQHGTLRLSKD